MVAAATQTLGISGRTRLLVQIGNPLNAVKSPQLFNSLLTKEGRDAVCVPMQVPADGLEAFVRGIRQVSNLDGMLVTMPHKTRMIEFLDELHPTAHAMQAVNVVRNDNGRWIGAMFDGWGCVLGMQWEGHDPRGKRVLVVGAGGAGSAIAFAIAEAGASAVTVFDVAQARGQALVNAVSKLAPSCDVSFGNSDPTRHDIIINATPLGMRDGDAMPVDPKLLSAHSTVVDIVIQPTPTAFYRAAQSRGCRVQDGRALHEGQAVYAAKFLDLAYWPEDRPRVDLPFALTGGGKGKSPC